MDQPYIIVTLGPTGSGKTSLISETISYLNLEPDYVKILIDDLVENNRVYKQEVLSIIKGVLSKCKEEGKYCKNAECDECDTSYYYLNPTDELLEKFSEAYFSTRRGPNCVQDSEHPCDKIINDRLNRAIYSNQNIVFETTGGYIPTWLLSSPFISSRYQIIFTYSIVQFDKLIKRNIDRTIKAIDAFFNDQTRPGPRLPDVRHHRFKKTVSVIKDVLLNLYDKCIISFDDGICGTEKIDTLLIFDNSGEKMKLAFDSNSDRLSDAEFSDLVNSLFRLDSSGGRRKRSIQRRKHYKTRRKSKKPWKFTKRRRYRAI